MVRLFAAIALASAVSLLLCGSALAKETARESYSLRWTLPAGASSCIGADELARAVEQRLGRPFLFSADGDAPLVLEGRIDRELDPAGWRAAIRLAGRDGLALGDRVLLEPGDDCRALDDKLTLIIALILDPDPGTVGLEAAPALAPAPGPAPRRHASLRAVVPMPATPAPWRLDIAVSGLAATGMLPGSGAGLGLSVAADPPWSWPVELAGTFWFEETAEGMVGGSRLSFATIGVALCPPLGRAGAGFVDRSSPRVDSAGGRLTIALCAGAEYGRMHARGFGFTRDEAQRESFYDLGLSARAGFDLTRAVFARMSAGGWLPLVRPRFYYEEEGSGARQLLFQPARASLVIQAGVGVRF